MHILFLTDNFLPEVNAPASRTFEHCRAWCKAGATVTVITCAPNFPKGIVYDGYRNRLWQLEMIDGIRVIRVWTFITANEGFWGRIADYVSFMLAGFVAALFVRRVDIVIGTSPQFFTVCAAWLTGALKRVPWVFELRDIWPESIKAVGAMKESRAIRWLERLEMFLYRKATRIIVVTHSFKTILMNRGIEGSKIDVITNGVDLSSFVPQTADASLARSLNLEGCFVAGYVGTHGLAHSLQTLLDAALILQQRDDTQDVRIVMLGDGAKKAELARSAMTMGLTNVIFLDSVPRAVVSRYWSLLDVSIIHLSKSTLFASVIPSKLFECMCMGIPVLHGVTGESADIVRHHNVGVVFEPENAEQLAGNIVQLHRDSTLMTTYRTNGPRAAALFDRSFLAAEMFSILKCTSRQ
jgi:glycosyltransferase involved in cell wall biosynthesis